MATITAIHSKGSAPSRIKAQGLPSLGLPARSSIIVGKRSVATLSDRAIAELGIAVGMEWTDALAARVDAMVRYEHALRRATASLARRPISVSRLRMKLLALAYNEATIERVIARLHELGLLDDERLARGLIAEWTRARPAGPALLRDKLIRAGIDESLAVALAIPASRAVPGPDTDTADDSSALALARREWQKRAALPKPTRLRRIAALLARRGFDDDAINDVIEQIAS